MYEIKLSVTDALAIIAILISLFTFYWTTIRIRRSLYLIDSTDTTRNDEIIFSLINAGNTDILLVRLAFGYYCENPTSMFWPAQVLSPNSEEIIEAKRGRNFSIRQTEKIEKTFIERGNKKNLGTGMHFVFDVYLRIEWIESSGRKVIRDIKYCEIGFREGSNSSKSYKPYISSANIYKYPKKIMLSIRKK